MAGVTKDSVNAGIFKEVCPTEDTKHVTIRTNHQSLWDFTKQVLNGKEKCIVVDDWILHWKYVFLFDQILVMDP